MPIFWAWFLFSMVHFHRMRTLRRRLIFRCNANQCQCHHLHRVMQLGLGGDNSHWPPPHPHYLLEQLELLVPPQAHPDHLHGHLLLLEEEWCPLPVKGVDWLEGHPQGVDDSIPIIYHCTIILCWCPMSRLYTLSRCLMSHDDSSLERHLFWSFDVIFYHSIKNTC